MTRNWARRVVIILALSGFLTACSSLKLNPNNLTTRIAPLPFNIPISFDDFTYDSQHRRVIIPAGETGQIALIDPTNMETEFVSGSSRQADSPNLITGTSSAIVAGNYLYALDPETMSIQTIKLGTGSLIASTQVQGTPDYIRFVSATGELWVTEKGLHQIEIFSVSGDDPPELESTGTISIPNGPEALVIDDHRGLAFTNRPDQSLTDVIQVMTHTVIAQWGSGCSSARGMAVDEDEGYLFVACEEGKLVMMDINNDGYQITSQNYGGELDFVAYNSLLHHVYLPSSASGVVAIFQLQKLPVNPEPTNAPEITPEVNPTAAAGAAPQTGFKTSLLLLGTADTNVNSKCVTSDEYNNIWVCDPDHGQVFIIHDDFPDSGAVP